MPHRTFRQEYMEIPPVTRTYTTACIITTILVQLDILSPFQLYFNPILIFHQYQVWRLLTTFLYFGSLGFNFLFNIIFTYRYCRMLEEGSFRGRTADFVVMIAPYLPWVILGFGILLGNSIFVDLIGIMVGHVYFFLEDIFPQKSGGIRLLKTPKLLKQLFEPTPEEPAYVPEEERPGGFPWGAEGRRPD